MKTALLLCLSIFTAAAIAESETQTDWSGGDGVPGPVTDWGDTFNSESNINWSGFPGDFIISRLPMDTPVEHIVSESFNGGHSLQAADIDGDEDIDIFAASIAASAIIWWENTDGSGTDWDLHLIASEFTGAESVFATDVDGDDDIDVCGAAYDANRIAWWENDDGSGTSWTEHSVDDNFDRPLSVFAADVNGDTFIDILGAAWGGGDITWWENVGGPGTTWVEHVVDGDYSGASSVYATDVDGDDDVDVLGSSEYTNYVTWWENSDVSGTTWTEHTIDDYTRGAYSVHAADLDGDDDNDVIAAAYDAHDVMCWLNADGSGTTWTEYTVDSSFTGALSLCTADVDQDGDLDILGAGSGIRWWENDGSGASWTRHVVKDIFSYGWSVDGADVDGDDDIDILGVADGSNDTVAWWEITEYAGNGFLFSSILDTEDVPYWDVIEWNADLPADTSLLVAVRASNDPGDMGTWVAVDSSGDDLSDYIGNYKRYFQYRVTLYSDDENSLSPTFEDITVNWELHPGVGDVELSASQDCCGVLIRWSIEGDTPAGLRVLREVDGRILPLHTDALPGSAMCYLDRGVEPGVEYRYWLEVTGADGTVERFGPTESVRIEPAGSALSLSEPYPSPASGAVTITFTLPDDGPVELVVYDLAGRRVATLVEGELAAGRHEVRYDVSALPAGVYLYRLATAKEALVQRMVVTR
jgi:hypothetical protein